MSESTRVSLTRFELLQLKDFAANVDCGCEPDDIARWDRMTQKLENALARLDGRKPRNMRTGVMPWTADPKPERREIVIDNRDGTTTKTTGFTLFGNRTHPRLYDCAVAYRGTGVFWSTLLETIVVYWWGADVDEFRSPDGLWPEGPTARGIFVWTRDFGWVQTSGPEAPVEVSDYLDDEYRPADMVRLPMEGDL